MPISWQYTDVYEVIIHYITNNLDTTNYMFNFGIISLHELRPKVIIRFTSKNIRNNLRKSWTQLLEGENLRRTLWWCLRDSRRKQVGCLVKIHVKNQSYDLLHVRCTKL